MNYSFNLITSSKHCNEILKCASLLLDELEFRKHQLSRSYRALVESRTKLNIEERDINSDIKKIKQFLTGIAEKEGKDDFKNRLVKLRHKKFLVGEKISRCDARVILIKELEINLVEKQRTEIEAFISSVKK